MNNLNIPIYRAKVIGLDNNYIIGFYQQYIEGFEDNVFHEINNNSAQVYQWQGNSLSEMKNEGNTTREYWNGQDGDIWEAVTIYEGLKFGYVIICDKNSNVKCQRTFTDESTGISAAAAKAASAGAGHRQAFPAESGTSASARLCDDGAAGPIDHKCKRAELW